MENLPKTKRSVRETFEIIAKDWNRLREKPWPVLLEFLKKFDFVQLFSNDFLLDLGCGNGRHSMLFADKTGHVVGVDFSLNLLSIATKKCISQNIDNISYVLADFSALPFRKKVFQSSIFLATLHHIPMDESRLDTIRGIKNILKENGYCLITVWRRWQKRFFWHFFKQIFHHIFKFKSFKEFGDIFIPWKKQDGESIQRFYHLFSQREIKNLARKVEFQAIFLKNFGGPTQHDNVFILLKNVN